MLDTSICEPVQLWLDLGNTRLKYWICDAHHHVLQQGAELHLQSPTDLLRGLIKHFSQWRFEAIGISSVLDHTANQQICHILSQLNAPCSFAKVHHHYKGLMTHYATDQLGIDRWLQVLAMTRVKGRYCIVGCGTAMTIDLLDHDVHHGGYILPGLHLQHEALVQGTRGIRINHQAFDSLDLAQNTADAVHHGIAIGIKGALAQVHQQFSDYEFILTGGDASLIQQWLLDQSGWTTHLEKDLLLQGLQYYMTK